QGARRGGGRAGSGRSRRRAAADGRRLHAPAPPAGGAAGQRAPPPGRAAREKAAARRLPARVSRAAPARFRTFTLAERPDLERAVHRLVGSIWPREMEYIHHDAVCGRHWGALYREFSEFQPVLCNARGIVVAAGFTIPLVWSGRARDLPSGVDGALERGVRGRGKGRAPNALSALLAAVAPAGQGHGLSARVIRAMTIVAARHELDVLIAPVRPTLKHRYPTTPMRRYVRWRRKDGAPFDPWLRVHWRLG